MIDRITGRQRPGILRVPRPWRIEWNRRPIVTELIVLHVSCVDSIGGRVVYHRRMLLVGEVLLGIRYVVLIVSRCCRVATRMWMTRWKKRLFLTHSAVVPGRTDPTCNINRVYLLLPYFFSLFSFFTFLTNVSFLFLFSMLPFMRSHRNWYAFNISYMYVWLSGTIFMMIVHFVNVELKITENL